MTTKAVTNVIGSSMGSTWRVSLEADSTICSLAEEAIIHIAERVIAKLLILLKWSGRREFTAFGVTSKVVSDKGNVTYLIHDLIVPSQEASHATVNTEFPEEVHQKLTEESEGKLGIYAIFHSHHNMGHKFSGIDDDNANVNNWLSILVSWSGFDAVAISNTPCGKEIRMPADIAIGLPGQEWIDEFIQEVATNINNFQPSMAGSNQGLLGFKQGSYMGTINDEEVESDFLYSSQMGRGPQNSITTPTQKEIRLSEAPTVWYKSVMYSFFDDNWYEWDDVMDGYIIVAELEIISELDSIATQKGYMFNNIH